MNSIISAIVDLIPDEGTKSISELKGKEVNINISSETESSELIEDILFKGDDRSHEVKFTKPNAIVNIVNYLGVPHYKFSTKEGMKWVEINAEGKVRDYNPYVISDEYIPSISFDDQFNRHILRELKMK